MLLVWLWPDQPIGLVALNAVLIAIGTIITVAGLIAIAIAGQKAAEQKRDRVRNIIAERERSYLARTGIIFALVGLGLLLGGVVGLALGLLALLIGTSPWLAIGLREAFRRN